MRIRLDKLFLSAGLALAVIATTIPVGAGVNTTTANGVTTVDGVVGYATSDGLPLTTESTKSLLAAISGVSTADTSAVETGVGGVKKQDALPSGLTVNKELFTGNQDVTAYIEEVDADYEFVKGYKVESDEDAFTQTTTYTVSGYEYTSTTAGSAVAAATAAKTAIINALKIENGSNSYSTYTVSVSENALTAHTASQPTEDSYAEGTKFTVDGSFTVTKTYTITSLPEGYRYDIVLDKGEGSNFEYKVAYNEGTKNGEYTNITDLDEEIVVSLTKLSGTYYLGKKTVSASGNLLFAPTEGDDSADANVVSGDYTARITNGSDEEIDLTEVADLPEDVKSAGKFKITVTKEGVVGAVANGPEITFKIAIPKDVQPTSADKKINWIVVRGHDYDDGNDVVYEIIPSTVEGDYIVFSSDKFSTYALLYTEVAADTTEEETNNETNNETESATEAGTETTTAGGTSTTSKTSSSGTADNSMMPLFMTTLLLALCVGSLAIYKEKKTN
ncbi:hypothetical protein [Lachnospira multipara]|uniref:hypothetical protein n=1 Tax=Lachnospira multipara TaxID=28051 RepID=UPI0004079975|nr:hypothetical protein [Lachnospira multipara]